MTSGQATMIVSLSISLLGVVLLTYGKRRKRVPQMIVGATLAGFPILVSKAMVMGALAALAMVLMWNVVGRGA